MFACKIPVNMPYTTVLKSNYLKRFLWIISGHYISVVVRVLEEADISYLMHADDIVLFHTHKDINISSELLNNSIVVFNNKLDSLHLSVAAQKCKVVIFTRKRSFVAPIFQIEGAQLPLDTQVTFLGLLLESDLRWWAYILHISSFVSRWSKLLRSQQGRAN